MRGLYTIGIWFYCFGVHVAAACGHRNARLMLRGWHHWREELAKLDGRPVVWFHAASLGEFEQARPVLESYRERHPDHQVLLTFFSPSGYEVRKNYAKAEAVCYLPPDLPLTVHRFIRQTNNLQAAFFVKYDFWFNYLGALRKSHVPTYIFSAIFRPEQYFFKPWGRWFVRQLRDCFTHLFVQNDESLQLLRTHGIEQCTITGDTRFDRVHQIAVTAESDDTVERWLDGHVGSTIVCGSTWPPDEALISELRKQDTETRIILAPHVINEEHLKQIEHLFPDSTRYSLLTSGNSHAGYRRRLRGRHTQHTGGRNLRQACTFRAQLPQVQGGPRHHSPWRRLLPPRRRRAAAQHRAAADRQRRLRAGLTQLSGLHAGEPRQHNQDNGHH